MAENTKSVTEVLASLAEARDRATARVSDLEAEQRQASVTLATAKEAVAEFHRGGGGDAAEQKRLETALSKAKAEADAPWAERIEGARRAARDAHQPVQVFVAKNLHELVQVRQADGAAAADRINAAATELLAAYGEWNRIATGISGLAALVWTVRPGDVSTTRCEALAKEASRLLQEGGEVAPALRRDPRTDPAVPVEVEPEPEVVEA
jgi:hypothetical protein